jgi:hypothetical protein
MELDADFIYQLKSEIDKRQLTSMIQNNEHSNDPQVAGI